VSEPSNNAGPPFMARKSSTSPALMIPRREGNDRSQRRTRIECRDGTIRTRPGLGGRPQSFRMSQRSGSADRFTKVLA